MKSIILKLYKTYFFFFLLMVLDIIFILFCSTKASSQTNILWSEDWTVNWTDNWYVGGGAGTWEVGKPTSGPGKAFSGDSCAATVLSGNYSEPVDSKLIRRTSFVVPPVSMNPRLRFWHWYSFSTYDYGEVQIKVSGGNWKSISPRYDNTSSNVWTYTFIDLSAYADSSVQIAFYFHSHRYYDWPNQPNTSSGWYIDAISVITDSIVFNNPEYFETGIGDWYSERGTWEIGKPASGPDSAFSPPFCAATVLAGEYWEPVDSRLISPVFIVPHENAGLSFWQWFSFSTYDYGVVQIKTNGEDWRTISEPVFTNTSSGIWSFYYIDLSDYADSTARIAFYFHSHRYYDWPNGPNTSSGWYLDNIEIEGIPTSVKEKGLSSNIIDSYLLNQNYPNPFNPSTTFKFSIPYSTHVVLKIYDVLGKEVATLIDEELPMGQHKVNWNVHNLASGVYIYKIQAGEFVQTRKMILMR